MQRQRIEHSVLWSTVIGLMLLGEVAPVTAAEAIKKPADQAPASAAKTAPEKKSAITGGSQKAKPAAKGPTPKYTSAETAAKAQACFGETPKIQSVTPDEGKAGETITISGKGFGPTGCLRSLSFGPGYPAAFTFVNDTQITATVPKGRRKGMAMLTVTTASGEDSKGFLVK